MDRQTEAKCGFQLLPMCALNKKRVNSTSETQWTPGGGAGPEATGLAPSIALLHSSPDPQLLLLFLYTAQGFCFFSSSRCDQSGNIQHVVKATLGGFNKIDRCRDQCSIPSLFIFFVPPPSNVLRSWACGGGGGRTSPAAALGLWEEKFDWKSITHFP